MMKPEWKNRIKLLGANFIIFLTLIYLAEKFETLSVFLVYLIWISFLRIVKILPWNRIFSIEFFAALPLLLTTPVTFINKFSGIILASTIYLFLIFASFLIRIVLLQKWTKNTRFHNITMIAVVIMMFVCFESFLKESELGLRFQMRNLGVEYVLNKSLFWAPKDLKEKLFQTNREYIINDVMNDVTHGDQKGKTIFFFGGSATAGAGLKNPKDAFAYQVKRDLAENGIAVNVVNSGVGGYTSFQIRRLVENYIHSIQANLFVFYIGYNDTHKSYGRYTHKQMFEMLYGDDTRKGASTVGAIQKTLGRLHTYNFLVKAMNYLKVALQDTRLDITVRAVPLDDLEENLDVIYRMAKQYRIPILICAEAYNDQPHEGQYLDTHRVIKRFATEYKVPFIQVQDEIKKVPGFEKMFYDEVHLKPDGHAFVADLITKKIIEEDLLDIHPKTKGGAEIADNENTSAVAPGIGGSVD